MSDTTKNIFTLKTAYELINAGCIQYSAGNREPGSLWAWGRNAYSAFGGPGGQLGDNTVINRSSPVQIPGVTWVEISQNSETFRSLARKSDGTLWSWGADRKTAAGGNGALGLNDTSHRSSPTQIPGTQWCFIGMGYEHAHAIKSDGTLWGWGNNTHGRLGLNDVIHRSSPTQITGTQWVEVAGGACHALARKTDGTLWSWGYNGYGQLGDNTIIRRSSPVQVPGTSWNDISTGGAVSRSFARKIDGTLWSWGSNNSGVLGLNDLIHRSSPVQIPGTSWNNILNGRVFQIAQKTDNTLWSWGDNGNGQLGDGTTIHKSSPVQIPGTQWKTVTVGGQHSLAIKGDSTLWVWGRGNSYGALGDITTIDKCSPVQIPGSWNDVGAGHFHSFARKIV